uniref:Phosphoglycolate phosphatase n=1 Tax=Arion vulgaris TaxID=1028688 RepID=A0A0B7BHK2_9EUPU
MYLSRSLFSMKTRLTSHSMTEVVVNQIRKASQKMSFPINQEKAKDIIDNVDNFLFDCDGVLWDGNGVIAGSLAVVLKLKQLGKKVFYVTNNSSSSRQDYVKKCNDYGFPAEKDDIVCTAYIAAQYLHSINFKDKVYLIGKEESIGHELDQVGIRYFGPGPDPLIGTGYNQWLKDIYLDAEVSCVLVGFDPHISFMKIMRAASYLKNPDCLYIATNEDGSLPAKDSNICIPGTGCMVLPVTVAAERDPIVMGKPSTNMFDVLKKIHNLDPSRCMMTGDRISTDITFAKTCGMRSLLVLSGISTINEICQPGQSPPKQANLQNQPDLYAQNLAEFGKYI